MSFKCWEEKETNTDKRPYYLNLESGISQWGVPANKLLPAGWEMHLSKSQSKHFFTNSQKNISQWNIPTKEDGNKAPEGWEEMRTSKCNNIYYRNTKTGDLQWPHSIVDSFVKPVGVGIPTRFLPIVQDCTQNKKWQQHKLLGSGKSGNVYVTCKSDDCEYVIKIQKENKDYYTEIEALLSLQHTKAVPIVFAAWTCKKMGYFVIEKLYSCEYNQSIMWEKVGKQLDIIREAGYLHVDIHKNNVMCNKDGKVVIIDFGYAVKRTEQGDKQEYPENPISKSYKLPVTWKYLEVVQKNNHNRYFNPAAIGIDTKSITTEHRSADEKCKKEYRDAREKLLINKRKQKGDGTIRI